MVAPVSSVVVIVVVLVVIAVLMVDLGRLTRHAMCSTLYCGPAPRHPQVQLKSCRGARTRTRTRTRARTRRACWCWVQGSGKSPRQAVVPRCVPNESAELLYYRHTHKFFVNTCVLVYAVRALRCATPRPLLDRARTQNYLFLFPADHRAHHARPCGWYGVRRVPSDGNSGQRWGIQPALAQDAGHDTRRRTRAVSHGR